MSVTEMELKTQSRIHLFEKRGEVQKTELFQKGVQTSKFWTFLPQISVQLILFSINLLIFFFWTFWSKREMPGYFTLQNENVKN